MSARNYWIFTLVFWLLATGLLFLNMSSFQMGHWQQVSFRFFYIPLLGIALCAMQTLVFQADGFRTLRFPQPWVVLLAIAAAFLTALTLNLITYLLLNLSLAEHRNEIFHNGAAIFFLLYLFWSFIWFQMEGRPLLGPKPEKSNGYIDRMTIEHQGQPVTVQLSEVEYFAASGDYVEIQLPNQSYLKKGTISALENMLDPAKYQRIHRSTIVNNRQVDTISARGSGAYELSFTSGHKIRSSRSYLAVVQRMQG
jgi:DNA-binding LytR/AlgR family response regulator